MKYYKNGICYDFSKAKQLFNKRVLIREEGYCYSEPPSPEPSLNISLYLFEELCYTYVLVISRLDTGERDVYISYYRKELRPVIEELLNSSPSVAKRGRDLEILEEIWEELGQADSKDE